MKTPRAKEQTYRRIRKGFTLVEILIVLAIVALLSALLLSVFSNVRGTSRKMVCTSNLHQIGLAFQMYVQDAQGHFPPFTVSQNENCGWAEQIYPYTKSTEVFRCPSFPYGEFRTGCPAAEKTNDDSFPFSTWRGSYDRNNFAGPGGTRILYLRNPSATILLCDGTGGGEFFGVEDNTAPINPRDFTKLGNRHNYGSNVYFADGHTKWIKYEDLLDIKLWKAR